jgi:hypothetical protein
MKWLDNRTKVESFYDGIIALLAIGRVVVVIGAFENKAEVLGHQSKLHFLSQQTRYRAI